MENIHVATIKYRGFDIHVFQDKISEDPRDWMDHLGNMICFHRRYNIGDKHDFNSPDDIDDFFEENPHVKLPIYMLEHSGISISTSPFGCPWDSGHIGWIYATIEEIEDVGLSNINIPENKEKVIEILKTEIKEYDMYLRGQVYGYSIPPDIDSCWGFYGLPEDSGLIEEAQFAIDHYIEEYSKSRLHKLKLLIKNKVPIEVRENIMKKYSLCNV